MCPTWQERKRAGWELRLLAWVGSKRVSWLAAAADRASLHTCSATRALGSPAWSFKVPEAALSVIIAVSCAVGGERRGSLPSALAGSCGRLLAAGRHAVSAVVAKHTRQLTPAGTWAHAAPPVLQFSSPRLEEAFLRTQ